MAKADKKMVADQFSKSLQSDYKDQLSLGVAADAAARFQFHKANGAFELAALMLDADLMESLREIIDYWWQQSEV